MAQYDLPANYNVFHYYNYLGNSNIYNNNNKKKNSIAHCRNIAKSYGKFIERNKIDIPKIKTTYNFTSLTLFVLPNARSVLYNNFNSHTVVQSLFVLLILVELMTLTV